jgi:hypothetical protein
MTIAAMQIADRKLRARRVAWLYCPMWQTLARPALARNTGNIALLLWPDHSIFQSTPIQDSKRICALPESVNFCENSKDPNLAGR